MLLAESCSLWIASSRTLKASCLGASSQAAYLAAVYQVASQVASQVGYLAVACPVEC